jgi:Protein of unknown function (DUF2934)
MIASKVQNQPKPNRIVVIPPQASPATAPLIAASEPHDSSSQRQIRARAFEFFKERGSKPGHDMQDWLRAEGQIVAP